MIRESRPVVLWLIGGLFLLLVVLSYLRWPLWPDHSLYLYMGKCWQRGLLPYRDIFDQNWPGIIWISQLITYLVRPTQIGVRIFDLIWQSLSGVVLFAIARRNLSYSRASISVFLYMALYLAASYGSTAQREGFACLFLGIALLLLRDQVGSRFSWLPGAFAGLMLAAGVFIKPTLGLIPICLFLYYLFHIFKNRMRCWSLVLGLVLGTGLPFVLYLGYLIQTDTLSYFFDASVVYAAKYTHLDPMWFLRRLCLFLVVYPPGRLTILCIVLAILMWKGKLACPGPDRVLAVFVLGSFLSLLVQRRLAYYHSMPFCYFASVFVMTAFEPEQGLGKIFKWHLLKKHIAGKIAICSALVFVLPVGIDLPLSMISIFSGQSATEYGDQRRTHRGRAPWSMVQRVGAIIRSTTGEDTRVLCFAGSDSPEYYLVSGRDPVFRYVQMAHFVFDEDRLDAAFARIQADKLPKVLIIVESKTSFYGQDFYDAATEGMNVKTLFQADYAHDASIRVYYISENTEQVEHVKNRR